jgi:hypothetical protein
MLGQNGINIDNNKMDDLEIITLDDTCTPIDNDFVFDIIDVFVFDSHDPVIDEFVDLPELIPFDDNPTQECINENTNDDMNLEIFTNMIQSLEDLELVTNNLAQLEQLITHTLSKNSIDDN